MGENKKKQMVAPIIVSIIIILYYILYFGLIILVLDGLLAIAFGIIPLVLSFIVVKVCIERIKEIKEGEEDDLSKY